MDGNSHNIVAMIFMAILMAFGLLTFFGSSINQFVFLITFIIFSTKLNPDIDQKLPFIPHRGLTHNNYGLIVLGTLIIIGIIFILPQGGIKLDSWLLPIILGAITGWILHILTDAVHDRLHQFTWFVIALIVIILCLVKINF